MNRDSATVASGKYCFSGGENGRIQGANQRKFASVVSVPPTKKRPAIPRLDGGPQTIILVEEVARSVDFYGDVLRLELRDGDTDRYAEFDTGDGGVLLLVKRDGTIAPMAAAASADSPKGLTFVVEDTGFDSWKRWLAKRGVEIEREAKLIHGGRSLVVRDPDKRKVEFKTPASVKAPTRPPMPIERKKEE